MEMSEQFFSFSDHQLLGGFFEPSHWWLEDDSFPFGMSHFQGQTVGFREDIYIYSVLLHC